MKEFGDDSGQFILIACVGVSIALVMMATYEYSTMETGEMSINRENMDSFYYYESIRDKYYPIYNDPAYLDFTNPKNRTVFENEIKNLALLHGFSVDFIHNGSNTTIIFVDKDIRIEERLD